MVPMAVAFCVDEEAAVDVAGTGRESKARKGIRYIPALDGLRAVAVLAVIAYHLGLPGCQGGLMGVTVFFVISGYIVTKILVVEYSRTGSIDFKGFYLRRAKRLLPAIVLVVMATAALCTLFDHALLTKMRPEVLPSLLFVNNWWQVLNDASYFASIGLPSPLTHFWSLAIEEQFYLVLPLSLFAVLRFGGRLGRRRSLSAIILGLAALSALEMALLYDPAVDPTRVYYGTDTRAFSLLIGAFLAVATTGNRRQLPQAARAGLAAVGAVGVLACLAFMGGSAPFTYYGGMLLCSALTAALIYGTMGRDAGPIGRALGSRPMLWVGKRSYGIYLWHYPIILLLTPPNSAEGITGWGLVLAVVLIFVVAALSYTFVENPIRYGLGKQTGLTPSQGAKAPHGPRSSSPAIVSQLVAPPSGASPKRRRALPLQPAALVVAGALSVVSVGGLALVGDASSMSDDGAAIIARDAMAGQPLSQDVALVAEGAPVLLASTSGDPAAEGAAPKPVYDVLMIGDSVSLRAVDAFEERFPLGHLDAHQNRVLKQGIATYQEYADAGQVGDIVIFALGTNGVLTDDDLRAAVEAVGPDRQVYFVTVRNTLDTMEANNTALNRVRDAYDNVRLIDWNSLSASHGDYFDGDGTHLTESAARIYVQFIADVLQYPTAEELLAAAEATTQEAAEGTARPATPEGPATVGA